MARIISRKEIQEQMQKQHQSYVLITCDHPAEDGDMHVEMSYDGDPTLLSYLLEGAKSRVDEIECLEEES